MLCRNALQLCRIAQLTAFLGLIMDVTAQHGGVDGGVDGGEGGTAAAEKCVPGHNHASRSVVMLKKSLELR
ncbi:hypothetical protein MA13_contig00001-0267 [Edwardsiella piscicida]|nr:hypothetical protein QY76_09075 [Edwardsiella sp. EA181011]RFT02348.1 hypothetical protein CGL57_13335 [Edwardsiella anguillarum]GAJ66144.1 hypothetical protein MA13_contig00001-0267 [Edwardsiella piscicida]